MTKASERVPVQWAIIRNPGNFRGSEPSWQLKCPTCESRYVHMGEPNLVDSDVEGGGYGAGWEGRGDLFVIPYSGECGSDFEICFGQHKGHERLLVRVVNSCRAIR